MKGLKTQETSKFIKFFELVQKAAEKEKKVFFLDAGDGRDLETEDLEGEDLSGWLIPESKVNEFTPIWKENKVNDNWSKFFAFAIWEQKDDVVSISFE